MSTRPDCHAFPAQKRQIITAMQARCVYQRVEIKSEAILLVRGHLVVSVVARDVLLHGVTLSRTGVCGLMQDFS